MSHLILQSNPYVLFLSITILCLTELLLYHVKNALDDNKRLCPYILDFARLESHDLQAVGYLGFPFLTGKTPSSSSAKAPLRTQWLSDIMSFSKASED